MKFNTAGNLGDSIYSLLFMRELSEALNQSIDEVHLQINKLGSYSQKHVYGNVQLTENAAQYLMPLFASQLMTVSISDKCPDGFIDLDRFRQLRISFSSNDIRLWYYQLIDISLPMNLSRKTLNVSPDKTFANNIILAKTSRYNNIFLDYNLLKPLAKQIVMIGLEEEWQDFCKNYFYVEYFPTNNALHAAQLIAGCKMFMANQCGLFSIAESLKTPRMLFTAEYIDIEKNSQHYAYPGPCNVICQGGNCSMIGTNAKLEGTVKRLLNEKG